MTNKRERKMLRNKKICEEYRQMRHADLKAIPADCMRGLAARYGLSVGTIRIALKEEGLA